MGAVIAMLTRWRARRDCFHHSLPTTNRDGDRIPAVTFIRSWLIDTGMRKMFRCSRCGRTWIV